LVATGAKRLSGNNIDRGDKAVSNRLDSLPSKLNEPADAAAMDIPKLDIPKLPQSNAAISWRRRATDAPRRVMVNVEVMDT
jgi:hypothetical protein